MERESFVLDGYAFGSAEELQRAKKEKETILYIRANIDLTKEKEMYQIYEKAVRKKSFQTIVGMEFLGELRKNLLACETISEDMLDPVPVSIMSQEKDVLTDVQKKLLEKKVETYREECEKAKAGRVVKNFLMGVMALLIVAMLIITYKSQYSVFTYFTNYKETMREELIDQYEEWETNLREREKALEENASK